MKGWYRHPNPGSDGFFYTPMKRAKTHHFHYGDGVKEPTPEQVADTLNRYDNDEDNVNYERGGYFVNYNHAVAHTAPVKIPSGAYSFEQGNNELPPRIVPLKLRSDGYIRVPGLFDKMKDDVDAFLKNEAVYRDMNIQYRRGVLLYGPPGNGKTAMIRELIRGFQEEHDAISIFFETMPGPSFLMSMRDNLDDRLKTIVFEELAAVLDNNRIERVLDFLDGERSLDRAIIFATTNYPEKLPGNIVDRPSRFDRLYRMEDPSAELRRHFLKYFLKEEPTDELVKATNDLSVVALREVAILSRTRNFTIPQAVKALKSHREVVKKNFSAKEGSLGLHARYRDEEDSTSRYNW